MNETYDDRLSESLSVATSDGYETASQTQSAAAAASCRQSYSDAAHLCRLFASELRVLSVVRNRGRIVVVGGLQ